MGSQNESTVLELEHRARNRNPSITMRAGGGDERPEHSHEDEPKKERRKDEKMMMMPLVDR